jgi:hypothetical protein
VFRFTSADDGFWCEAYARPGAGPDDEDPPLDAGLRDRLASAFRSDASRLRAFADQPLPFWSV